MESTAAGFDTAQRGEELKRQEATLGQSEAALTQYRETNNAGSLDSSPSEFDTQTR